MSPSKKVENPTMGPLTVEQLTYQEVQELRKEVQTLARDGCGQSWQHIKNEKDHKAMIEDRAAQIAKIDNRIRALENEGNITKGKWVVLSLVGLGALKILGSMFSTFIHKLTPLLNRIWEAGSSTGGS